MSQLENMTFDRKITRRDLIKVFGAAAVAGTGIFGASNKAFAKSAPHVVVLGGGVGGSTFQSTCDLPIQTSKSPSLSSTRNTSPACEATMLLSVCTPWMI